MSTLVCLYVALTMHSQAYILFSGLVGYLDLQPGLLVVCAACRHPSMLTCRLNLFEKPAVFLDAAGHDRSMHGCTIV